MKQFLQLIDEHHIQTKLHISSKKALFEHIAKHVSELHPSLADEELVCALMQREKLGTTCIGQGIAIPHCRLNHCHKSILGLFTLAEPIIYNDDNQEADIIALLLVPESANEEHLVLLSEFAQHLHDPHVRAALRSVTSSQEALNVLMSTPTTMLG